MGRGCPICESVCKMIVDYLKNNVPQYKNAKALQISSSTVHNIIKRFRETGEISVRTGQGRRPLSDKSKCDILVGNHGRRDLQAKEEGDLPACYQRSIQNPASLMVSAYGMGSLHVLEGTMNAERYIKVLEQHMLPSRWCLFQQDNAKPHTAAITTAWFRSRWTRVLNWPASSPDNIWCIISYLSSGVFFGIFCKHTQSAQIRSPDARHLLSTVRLIALHLL